MTIICVFAHTHLYIFRLTGNAHYDILQPNDGSSDHRKQTWIVNIDPSDGTFRFESTYWNRGNYLIANMDDWEDPYLYCDDDSSQKWKVFCWIVEC